MARAGSCRQVAVRSFAAADSVPKAAFLVIGDEILSGKIQDTNTHALTSRLFKQGVDTVRVEVVPDDVETIIERSRALRELVGDSGFVFTSGGIGSTHDDKTYEALAKGAGVGLEVDEETVALMKESMRARGQEMNAARLRMATLPVGCEKLRTEGLWVPMCRLDNIYILPGIPRLFTRMLDAHLHRFQGVPSTRVVLGVPVPEGDLSDALRAVAEAADPGVSIGSYPQMPTQDAQYHFVHYTRVTFEGRDAGHVEAAVAAFQAAFPAARDAVREGTDSE